MCKSNAHDWIVITRAAILLDKIADVLASTARDFGRAGLVPPKKALSRGVLSYCRPLASHFFRSESLRGLRRKLTGPAHAAADTVRWRVGTESQ